MISRGRHISWGTYSVDNTVYAVENMSRVDHIALVGDIVILWVHSLYCGCMRYLVGTLDISWGTYSVDNNVYTVDNISRGEHIVHNTVYTVENICRGDHI